MPKHMIQKKDLDRMREVVALVAGVRPENINMRDYLDKDLSLDFLDMSNMRFIFEDKFEIDLPDFVMPDADPGRAIAGEDPLFDFQVKDVIKYVAAVVKEYRGH